jgi:hypothetical protein
MFALLVIEVVIIIRLRGCIPLKYVIPLRKQGVVAAITTLYLRIFINFVSFDVNLAYPRIMGVGLWEGIAGVLAIYLINLERERFFFEAKFILQRVQLKR